MSEIERCFNDTSIEISDHFSRYKHWFQKNGTFYRHHENAVVVLQVRNVYDWVKGMWVYPHHAPDHFNLDWQTFVTKPWTLDDAPKLTQEDWEREGPHCVGRNRPDEVIPCQDITDREVPIYYELNPKDGSVYQSIIDLRRDKILNHLAVQNFVNVSTFAAVRYEDMVEKGTATLIETLEDALGLKAHCKPSLGRPLVRKEAIDPLLVDWLTAHVDWETEGMVGYKPWNDGSAF